MRSQAERAGYGGNRACLGDQLPDPRSRRAGRIGPVRQRRSHPPGWTRRPAGRSRRPRPPQRTVSRWGGSTRYRRDRFGLSVHAAGLKRKCRGCRGRAPGMQDSIVRNEANLPLAEMDGTGVRKGVGEGRGRRGPAETKPIGGGVAGLECQVVEVGNASAARLAGGRSCETKPISGSRTEAVRGTHPTEARRGGLGSFGAIGSKGGSGGCSVLRPVRVDWVRLVRMGRRREWLVWKEGAGVTREASGDGSGFELPTSHVKPPDITPYGVATNTAVAGLTGGTPVLRGCLTASLRAGETCRGVATNTLVGVNHGRDARATGTPYGVTTDGGTPYGVATNTAVAGITGGTPVLRGRLTASLRAGETCCGVATNTLVGGNHGRDARATGMPCGGMQTRGWVESRAGSRRAGTTERLRNEANSGGRTRVGGERASVSGVDLV